MHMIAPLTHSLTQLPLGQQRGRGTQSQILLSLFILHGSCLPFVTGIFIDASHSLRIHYRH